MLRKAFQAIVGCLVVLCLGIDLASAQPATAPAAQLGPVDQTTPKGALKMLSRATQAGETATLKQLFHATNPQQQKIADSMIDRAEVFDLEPFGGLQGGGQPENDAQREGETHRTHRCSFNHK